MNSMCINRNQQVSCQRKFSPVEHPDKINDRISKVIVLAYVYAEKLVHINFQNFGNPDKRIK